MNLSKDFRLDELIKSNIGTRLGIDNTPDAHVVKNLTALCKNVLQPVRDQFGSTIVSSGYRCAELNAAVGSSSNSQHKTGCAADFECANASNLDVAHWISKNLKFDQLILEFYDASNPRSGWVHCSYVSDRPNRNQVLTINAHGVAQGLPKTLAAA